MKSWREDKQAKVNESWVKDHAEGEDDTKEITEAKIQKMERLERFEYRFPFYRMDVNGYQAHLRKAMKQFQPEKATFDIKCINLKSL